jgi:RimJ/RimL family protein N-acetyltransferase
MDQPIMTFPLRSERLTIQPLTLEQLETFVGYRSDAEIARFQSWDAPYSASQALELIQSQKDMHLPPKGEWLQLAILLIDSGEHIGDLALHYLDEPGFGFEIGFTIAKGFQGRGFAKEAVAELVSCMTQELKAQRIVATSDRRNLPSIRVLNHLGFAQRTDKSWDEYFKGEDVTVDYFELVHTQQVNHKHQGAT